MRLKMSLQLYSGTAVTSRKQVTNRHNTYTTARQFNDAMNLCLRHFFL